MSTLLSVLTSKGGVAVISGVLSGASGVAVGYFVAQKKLEKCYIAVSNREIAEARRFYQNKLRAHTDAADLVVAEIRAGVLTPDSSSEDTAAVADALLAYAGDQPVLEESDPTQPQPDFDVTADGTVRQNTVFPRPEKPNQRVRYDQISTQKPPLEVVAHNIFTDQQVAEDDQPDLEVEKAKRNEDYPYVITEEEFLENEPEHDQLCLTYFAEDDVLADDHDIPTPDPSGVVGVDNLKFGQWSNAPDRVYVRNPKLGSDFEVHRSNGSYAAEVMGLRHSEEPRRKVRRMRPDDD